MRLNALIFIFIIPFSLKSLSSTSTKSDPCKSPIFFKTLMNAEKTKKDFQISAQHSGLQTLTVSLHINGHSPDCGTPDSYGNELILKMILKSSKTKCLVQNATLTSFPWGDEAEARKNDPKEKYRDVYFFTIPKNIDLNDLNLKSLILRNSELKQALLFANDKYYFYNNVSEQTELIPANGDSYNQLFIVSP